MNTITISLSITFTTSIIIIFWVHICTSSKNTTTYFIIWILTITYWFCTTTISKKFNFIFYCWFFRKKIIINRMFIFSNTIFFIIIKFIGPTITFFIIIPIWTRIIVITHIWFIENTFSTIQYFLFCTIRSITTLFFI